jgi:predicted transcriptional regulator
LESISDQLKNMLEDKNLYRSSNLFRCILGLNELESTIFSYLLKNKKVSTGELAKAFEKDRSLIQRALQNLIELKIIKRESMSRKEFFELKGKKDMNKRGYLYIYSAKDLSFVKKQFRELLDKWHHSMITYIENLDRTFDCYENEGLLC